MGDGCPVPRTSPSKVKSVFLLTCNDHPPLAPCTLSSTHSSPVRAQGCRFSAALNQDRFCVLKSWYIICYSGNM